MKDGDYYLEELQHLTENLIESQKRLSDLLYLAHLYNPAEYEEYRFSNDIYRKSQHVPDEILHDEFIEHTYSAELIGNHKYLWN